MRTLYYLMDRLDTAGAMAETLRELNVDDNGYYIVSKDHDGVRRQSLHDASVFSETDLVHSGLRGALIGGLSGLLFALWIAIMKPFGMEMSLLTFLFVGFLPPRSGGRRRALEELASERSTLVFHESPLRILDSLAEGVIITDDRSRILYANHRMQEISGYTPAELLGRVQEPRQNGYPPLSRPTIGKPHAR